MREIQEENRFTENQQEEFISLIKTPPEDLDKDDRKKRLAECMQQGSQFISEVIDHWIPNKPDYVHVKFIKGYNDILLNFGFELAKGKSADEAFKESFKSYAFAWIVTKVLGWGANITMGVISSEKFGRDDLEMLKEKFENHNPLSAISIDQFKKLANNPSYIDYDQMDPNFKSEDYERAEGMVIKFSSFENIIRSATHSFFPQATPFGATNNQELKSPNDIETSEITLENNKSQEPYPTVKISIDSSTNENTGAPEMGQSKEDNVTQDFMGELNKFPNIHYNQEECLALQKKFLEKYENNVKIDIDQDGLEITYHHRDENNTGHQHPTYKLRFDFDGKYYILAGITIPLFESEDLQAATSTFFINLGIAAIINLAASVIISKFKEKKDARQIKRIGKEVNLSIEKLQENLSTVNGYVTEMIIAAANGDIDKYNEINEKIQEEYSDAQKNKENFDINSGRLTKKYKVNTSEASKAAKDTLDLIEKKSKEGQLNHEVVIGIISDLCKNSISATKKHIDNKISAINESIEKIGPVIGKLTLLTDAKNLAACNEFIKSLKGKNPNYYGKKIKYTDDVFEFIKKELAENNVDLKFDEKTEKTLKKYFRDACKLYSWDYGIFIVLKHILNHQIDLKTQFSGEILVLAKEMESILSEAVFNMARVLGFSNLENASGNTESAEGTLKLLLKTIQKDNIVQNENFDSVLTTAMVNLFDLIKDDQQKVEDLAKVVLEIAFSVNDDTPDQNLLENFKIIAPQIHAVHIVNLLNDDRFVKAYKAIATSKKAFGPTVVAKDMQHQLILHTISNCQGGLNRIITDISEYLQKNRKKIHPGVELGLDTARTLLSNFDISLWYDFFIDPKLMKLQRFSPIHINNLLNMIISISSILEFLDRREIFKCNADVRSLLRANGQIVMGYQIISASNQLDKSNPYIGTTLKLASLLIALSNAHDEFSKIYQNNEQWFTQYPKLNSALRSVFNPVKSRSYRIRVFKSVASVLADINTLSTTMHEYRKYITIIFGNVSDLMKSNLLDNFSLKHLYNVYPEFNTLAAIGLTFFNKGILKNPGILVNMLKFCAKTIFKKKGLAESTKNNNNNKITYKTENDTPADSSEINENVDSEFCKSINPAQSENLTNQFTNASFSEIHSHETESVEPTTFTDQLDDELSKSAEPTTITAQLDDELSKTEQKPNPEILNPITFFGNGQSDTAASNEEIKLPNRNEINNELPPVSDNNSSNNNADSFKDDTYIAIRIWPALCNGSEARSGTGMLFSWAPKFIFPGVSTGGHVSLEIVENSNTTHYISLHPAGKFGKSAILNDSVSEDFTKMYKMDPTDTIKLFTLNIDNIKNKWASIESTNIFYVAALGKIAQSVVGRDSHFDCASLTWELLHVGGVEQYFHHNWVGVPTPNNVAELIKQYKNAENEVLKNKHGNKPEFAEVTSTNLQKGSLTITRLG